MQALSRLEKQRRIDLGSPTQTGDSWSALAANVAPAMAGDQRFAWASGSARRTRGRHNAASTSSETIIATRNGRQIS